MGSLRQWFAAKDTVCRRTIPLMLAGTTAAAALLAVPHDSFAYAYRGHPAAARPAPRAPAFHPPAFRPPAFINRAQPMNRFMRPNWARPNMPNWARPQAQMMRRQMMPHFPQSWRMGGGMPPHMMRGYPMAGANSNFTVVHRGPNGSWTIARQQQGFMMRRPMDQWNHGGLVDGRRQMHDMHGMMDQHRYYPKPDVGVPFLHGGNGWDRNAGVYRHDFAGQQNSYGRDGDWRRQQYQARDWHNWWGSSRVDGQRYGGDQFGGRQFAGQSNYEQRMAGGAIGAAAWWTHRHHRGSDGNQAGYGQDGYGHHRYGDQQGQGYQGTGYGGGQQPQYAGGGGGSPSSGGGSYSPSGGGSYPQNSQGGYNPYSYASASNNQGPCYYYDEQGALTYSYDQMQCNQYGQYNQSGGSYYQDPRYDPRAMYGYGRPYASYNPAAYEQNDVGNGADDYRQALLEQDAAYPTNVEPDRYANAAQPDRTSPAHVNGKKPSVQHAKLTHGHQPIILASNEKPQLDRIVGSAAPTMPNDDNQGATAHSTQAGLDKVIAAQHGGADKITFANMTGDQKLKLSLVPGLLFGALLIPVGQRRLFGFFSRNNNDDVPLSASTAGQVPGNSAGYLSAFASPGYRGFLDNSQPTASASAPGGSFAPYNQQQIMSFWRRQGYSDLKPQANGVQVVLDRQPSGAPASYLLDHGNRIDIHASPDSEDRSILAILAVAQERWNGTCKLEGRMSDSFKQRFCELALVQGVRVTNPELAPIMARLQSARSQALSRPAPLQALAA